MADDSEVKDGDFDIGITDERAWDRTSMEELKKALSAPPPIIPPEAKVSEVDADERIAKAVVQKFSPMNGDVVIINCRGAVSDHALRRLGRSLYNWSKEHFERTGVKFHFLTLGIPDGIDVIHLSATQVADAVHNNRLVVGVDGTVVDTVRGIDEEEEG